MIDANEQYEKEYSHLVAQREQRAREISRRESEICAELIERSQTLLGAISLVEELDNPERCSYSTSTRRTPCCG